MAEKRVAEMTADELHAHIKAKDAAHRVEMTHLRALLRCLPGGKELLEKK